MLFTKIHHFFLALLALLTITTTITGCASQTSTNTIQPPAIETDAAAAISTEQPATFADEITLNNGKAFLKVTPSIGRITGFGLVNQADLLWRDKQANIAAGRKYNNENNVNNWINYGGDKVWPSVQAQWQYSQDRKHNWPPPHTYDGKPYLDITHTTSKPNTVTILSDVDAPEGSQIRREISLHPTEPIATITTTVKQLRPTLFDAHIWSVTQVNFPRYTLMDVSRNHPTTQKPYSFPSVPGELTEQPKHLTEHNAILIPSKIYKDGKAGTLGKWIASIYPNVIFLQQATFDPNARYVEATSLQTYLAGDYIEMETLSPTTHLQPGESITNTVIWSLIPTVPELTPSQAVEKIRASFAN